MGTHSQLASHGRRTCTPVAGRDDAVLFPASTSAFQGAGIGLFVSAIKNSLESHNKGAMGIFTRTGWIGGYLAAIGFTYTATRNTLLNTNTDDRSLSSRLRRRVRHWRPHRKHPQ